MIKIMFICTGNICRSAMAEGILKKRLEEEKIDAQVCSCGIYAQDGDLATYNAIQAAKEQDVDIANHTATNIKNSKIEEMDIILCATQSHKIIVAQLYPELKSRIYTIKEYAYGQDFENLDIVDPWGYDIETYRFTAKELKESIEKIVEKLK